MLTSMISTFFLVQIKLLGSGKEGLEGMDATDTSGNRVVAKKKETEVPSSEKADSADPSPDPLLNSLSSDASATFTKPQREAAIKANDKLEAFDAKKDKTEPFQQQLNPARYSASDDDDTPRHKPKIDYAATLESAYDNLDKLLSSDALRNMSEDTGRLAEKQQLLMGNIDKMTPIMEKAGNILGKLDIGGLMGGLQDKLKSFDKMKPKGIMDETTA